MILNDKLSISFWNQLYIFFVIFLSLAIWRNTCLAIGDRIKKLEYLPTLHPLFTNYYMLWRQGLRSATCKKSFINYLIDFSEYNYWINHSLRNVAKCRLSLHRPKVRFTKRKKEELCFGLMAINFNWFWYLSKPQIKKKTTIQSITETVLNSFRFWPKNLRLRWKCWNLDFEIVKL